MTAAERVQYETQEAAGGDRETKTQDRHTGDKQPTRV